MTKGLLVNFLKDRLLLIVFYLLNMSAIIVYFHLTEPANTEYFYPLVVGGFLLTIYLIIDWLRYYETNSAVSRMLNDDFAEMIAHTEEQKAFQLLLQKVNREHKSKYYEMNEKNKERVYFLSHWMHHLKTPVSVIELILNKEEKDSDRLLEKIQRENKRLHSSIEQGLTMIRMENVENDLEVKSVDLLHVLRKIMNERKRECIYQSIFPTIEFDGESALIVTDSKWNEVLLEQVVSNAIKYSSFKSGNKKLLFKVEQGETYTTLSVKDEGVGMPPYDVERVFQPFFTGENGRKYPNSTGIGLYLCKRIADKLGHTITVQSRVSVGTTVTVQWMTGKGEEKDQRKFLNVPL
ncbi:sensor histidine kinase [Sutcliffiella sp. NC1]|uniref:sensor histidine kinase n=1 Tax=Sutcliffiella sp. NC1 TaxID=3004096 RepID=UPI0022DDE65C|nr:sensor histidine kinase [Sutcliffiella sp. NC1]WBL15543.1 sensor histidine kinase [Sutcliffiella sp. NC1]